MDDILQMNIRDVPVSCRAKNVLWNFGLIKLDEIYDYTEQEFLRLPNFGRKSINEWNTFLQSKGLEKIKSMHRKYVSIKIPLDDYEKIAVVAKQNDRSVDSEILSIIAESVKSIDPPNSLASRVDNIERILQTLLDEAKLARDE